MTRPAHNPYTCTSPWCGTNHQFTTYHQLARRMTPVTTHFAFIMRDIRDDVSRTIYTVRYLADTGAGSVVSKPFHQLQGGYAEVVFDRTAWSAEAWSVRVATFAQTSPTELDVPTDEALIEYARLYRHHITTTDDEGNRLYEPVSHHDGRVQAPNTSHVIDLDTASQMPSRCEDYPCCGHTDGLGCNWTAPDYSDPKVAAAHHIGCDHNAGYCDYLPDDDDQEEYN